MFAYERRNQIVESIKKKGSVTVQELMKTYAISIETVRKDLSYLESVNLLKRVHGGAVAPIGMKSFKHLEERIDEHKGRKHELAKLAANLLGEKDIIALDSGSTAIEFVPIIKQVAKNLTIVTHSLDVFEMIKDDKDLHPILIGGNFLNNESAFYGHMALETIERLHFSKAFICPSAISLENGISDYEADLSLIQKSYIKHADQVIILADSSKFQKNAFIKLCDINVPKAIITDRKLDDTIFELYKQNGINILK